MSAKNKSFNIEQCDGKTEGESIAEALLRPQINAAFSIYNVTRGSDSRVTVNDFNKALAVTCKAIADGKLDRLEALLTSQALVLDHIFGDFLRRSFANAGQHIEAMETYMKLALKAQSQSRQTVETLTFIKNPPPFISQANIGQNVQVNNHMPVTDKDKLTRARKNKNQPNELLEQQTPMAIDETANKSMLEHTS